MSGESRAIRAAMPTGVPIGRVGVWWFLGGEVVLFGGLITCYTLLRLRHPEWAEDAARTILAVGALNTLVLLTSSLTMVLAFAAADEGRRERAARLMGTTMLLGLAFLLVKAFEYGHEVRESLTPTTSLFWSFYYLMTGLHALHVLGGLVVIGIIALGVRRGQNLQRVEYVGLYWHFVDIVWIILFPLLYLVS